MTKMTNDNLDYTLFSWSKQKGISPLEVTHAKGVYLYTADGKRYIDFSSGLMNVNIGHGNQRVTDAVVKQMQKVSYVTPSCVTEVRGELGKKIAEISPGNLTKTLFTVCGATSIDNAIKLARLYSGLYKIIARYRAFHGASYGAMTAGGDPRKLASDSQQMPNVMEVFARNLRNLLLQKPIRGRRVLAIVPGFKNGCKLAALDEVGNLLDQAVIHLVGKAERKAEGRAKLAEMLKQHSLDLAVIGNGTACREAEELLSDMLANELAETGAAYVIVNEAGASVYSTSPLGREEFPEYDATLRGAISIGRRIQDPLSELVKNDPASIGVGMYQHDVKAKHLQTSLDEVVESCVGEWLRRYGR